MNKKNSLLTPMLAIFFILYITAMASLCCSCSRIQIPGADGITKIEVCYKGGYCVSGQGENLDDVIDNFKFNYEGRNRPKGD